MVEIRWFLVTTPTVTVALVCEISSSHILPFYPLSLIWSKAGSITLWPKIKTAWYTHGVGTGLGSWDKVVNIWKLRLRRQCRAVFIEGSSSRYPVDGSIAWRWHHQDSFILGASTWWASSVLETLMTGSCLSSWSFFKSTRLSKFLQDRFILSQSLTQAISTLGDTTLIAGYLGKWNAKKGLVNRKTSTNHSSVKTCSTTTSSRFHVELLTLLHSKSQAWCSHQGAQTMANWVSNLSRLSRNLASIRSWWSRPLHLTIQQSK